MLQRVAGKSYPGYWGVPSGKIREGESPLKAVIRELFEETGILLSQDNLKEVHTFHVVNQDMNFLYTLFLTDLPSLPKIKLNDREHIAFEWVTPVTALRLDLVPDVDGCINEVFPQKQLELFAGYNPLVSTSINQTEEEARNSISFPSADVVQTENKLVSFGPPAVGKSSFLKALSNLEPNLSIITDTSWAKKGSNLNTFLRKAFHEGSRQFFFPFQMESILRRFLYTISAPENSAVDESIYTSLAYSRALLRLGWMTKSEFQVFYNYYLFLKGLMHPPTEILFIRCNVASIKSRIKLRRRRHENFYTDDYLTALQFAFSELADELERSGYLVTRLDSTKASVEELVEKYDSIKRDRD